MKHRMDRQFQDIALHVAPSRFRDWDHFMRTVPEYSIGLEVIDDTPGHRGHYVHFDHHVGVVREATMSAAMQAYIAVRQGRLMERWLSRQRPIPVYVWNADQDVCLASFILEYHHLLEREGSPVLRRIVQFNNKIDVCGGLYPVDLDEMVNSHYTWVFEPYTKQRALGKTPGDDALVKLTIRQVCDRLLDLLEGRAGIAPLTVEPEILYVSPYNFVVVDEKGDPNSRLVVAAKGHTNFISLVTTRPNGRYTYSVIRGSAYDDDIFQVPKLLEAFQAAEDMPNVRHWGGSNMAAGSDSEMGSSLHWTTLRDIAEPIVKRAYLENAASIDTFSSCNTTPRTRVLLAMSPEARKDLHNQLSECGVDVLAVASCAEAVEALDDGRAIDAIFSSLRLPDGGFGRLIAVGRQSGKFIPTIVCLPRLDGGWVDLLEAGASQVLGEPYSRDQIQQALADARRLAK